MRRGGTAPRNGAWQGRSVSVTSAIGSACGFDTPRSLLPHDAPLQGHVRSALSAGGYPLSSSSAGGAWLLDWLCAQ